MINNNHQLRMILQSGKIKNNQRFRSQIMKTLTEQKETLYLQGSEVNHNEYILDSHGLIMKFNTYEDGILILTIMENNLGDKEFIVEKVENDFNLEIVEVDRGNSIKEYMLVSRKDADPKKAKMMAKSLAWVDLLLRG